MEMGVYTVAQWMLFFYIYCFIGWVWETGYVSVKERKWVNRGFMHGPFLPIYGSGAIVILFATLPVKDHLMLVYILGLVSATVLEYCTGACMEKLFEVRYWDYSDQPFNLNGYICFFVSLAWGVFSVILVRFGHVPIEGLVLSIPKTAADIAAFALTIYVAVDFTQSFNEAIALREMLTKLSESNEQLRHLEKRVEVLSAIVDDEWQKYEESRALKKQSRKEWVEETLNRVREKNNDRLQKLEEQAKLYFRKNKPDSPEEECYMQELGKVRLRLHMQTDKEYKSLRLILERNPGAVSRMRSDALKEIKEMFHIKR